METKYLLFLEQEHETIIAGYLYEYFQIRKPIILKNFLFPLGNLKFTDEPVIAITQRTLAKELAENGSLNESIQGFRKAGIIILPDEPFVSIGKTGGKQINITNNRVAEQLKKSIDIILDESMPKHAILFI